MLMLILFNSSLHRKKRTTFRLNAMAITLINTLESTILAELTSSQYLWVFNRSKIPPCTQALFQLYIFFYFLQISGIM